MASDVYPRRDLIVTTPPCPLCHGAAGRYITGTYHACYHCGGSGYLIEVTRGDGSPVRPGP